MRILHNKNQNIEKSRINDNFSGVEKMEKLGVFKTFFLFLKLDIKKCPKWILKKKFAKMKITFFSTFFSDIFSHFSYDKWWGNFWRKCRWQHKKKREKIGFFSDFSGFFWFFSDRLDNFWIKFRIFWITVDNLYEHL